LARGSGARGASALAGLVAGGDPTASARPDPVKARPSEIPVLVGAPVAVVVAPVAALDEVVTTATACVEHALVGLAVAVVIPPIAALLRGISGDSVTLSGAIGRATLPTRPGTSAQSHGARLTDGERLVGASVTVLIVAVTHLLSAGIHVGVFVVTVQVGGNTILVLVYRREASVFFGRVELGVGRSRGVYGVAVGRGVDEVAVARAPIEPRLHLRRAVRGASAGVTAGDGPISAVNLAHVVGSDVREPGFLIVRVSLHARGPC
jgi:hypothetical protein